MVIDDGWADTAELAQRLRMGGSTGQDWEEGGEVLWREWRGQELERGR